MAAVVALLPGLVLADGIFDDSYGQTVGFTDALGATTMTMAFDGSSYWSTSGGGPDGDRLAEYDAAGVLQGVYQPGIDMRSVFTDANSGPVYARGFGSNQIRVQTSPGVFGNDVALSGGPLDAQSAVVFTSDGSEFRAAFEGTVTRWDRNGANMGTIGLSGHGTMGNEGSYPQARGLAIGGEYMLTYSDQLLSAWDDSGTRVGTTTLTGAGTSFDSHFSISYANDMVFVVDAAGGMWRGYAIPEIPEPATLGLLGLGSLAMLRRRR